MKEVHRLIMAVETNNGSQEGQIAMGQEKVLIVSVLMFKVKIQWKVRLQWNIVLHKNHRLLELEVALGDLVAIRS